MQREIRRPPQARRRLHLLRLHAGPDLRHRRPQPDAGRAEKIDEQYTAYLERERRSNIAAALAAKQQQPEPPPTQGWQQVSLRSEQGSPPPAETEKVPVPVASPVKQAARIRAAQCAKDQFSCEWPRLSEKVNELKKLFNPTAATAGGGQAEEELILLSSLRTEDP